MDEHTDDIMVALLPTETYWSTLEYPHLTLVYAGLVNDQPAHVHNELLKVANELAQAHPTMHLYSEGIDVLGPPDKQVDVVKIKLSTRLFMMRGRLVKYNASEYKEFKPHCTIGPVGSARNNIPEIIVFDRIVVAWGEDRMVYKLNG